MKEREGKGRKSMQGTGSDEDVNEEHEGSNAADFVDSSNDEREAKEEAARKENLFTFDSETIFMPSDEEFCNEQFQIGRVLVSNYKETKNSLINTVKIPKDLFGKDYPFSLSNKMIIVAESHNKGQHSGDKRSCKLAPACNRFWNTGDDIMKVQILACDEIEIPETSVWGCAHHALASIKGYALQTQRYQRYSKKSSVEKNGEIEDSGDKQDVVESSVDEKDKVANKEVIADDVAGTSGVGRKDKKGGKKSKPLSRKRKGTGAAVDGTEEGVTDIKKKK